jgi:hypothetical protein
MDHKKGPYIHFRRVNLPFITPVREIHLYRRR